MTIRPYIYRHQTFSNPENPWTVAIIWDTGTQTFHHFPTWKQAYRAATNTVYVHRSLREENR